MLLPDDNLPQIDQNTLKQIKKLSTSKLHQFDAIFK